MNCKKVAIIGSNSFLGNALESHLLSKGYEVLAFGKFSNGHTDFHEFNYPSKTIDFSLLDDCGAVVYCAAAGVQSNKSYPINDIYAVNAFLPIEIINYLTNVSYQGSFISFGSFFEIGNNSELHGYTEEEVFYSNKPVPNNYCDSKRLLSRFFSNNKFSIKWYHLILPSLYGKGENSNRLIPYLIDCLLNNKSVKLSAGTQVRQYIHINDLLTTVETCINRELKSGAYNVAPEEAITIKDLVKEVYKACQKEYVEAKDTINKPDESMKVLRLSPAKLKRELAQWPLITSIEQGIKSYL